MNLQNIIGQLQLALTPLKDVGQTVIFNKNLEAPVEESVGNFKLSANAGAAIKCKLFNDNNDDNDDPLAKSLQLDNAINAGDAFISYDVSCKLESGIALSVKEQKLGMSASGEVRHVSFIRHNNTEPLGTAIFNDLDLKTIVRPESITSLKDAEAVALFTTASFEFTGDFKVSESFTPVLGALSKLIGTISPIKAALDLSASFSASVAIKDDMAIVIQRAQMPGAKKFIVDIKKDFSKDLSLGGSLAVAASFDNPDVISDRIIDLIGQGEKIVIEKAEQLRSVVNLTDEQIQILIKAAKKLGVDVTGAIDHVKQEYFKKKDEIVEKIKDILKINIQIAASLEYEKQTSQQSLLHAVFDESAINNQFKDIIRAKVLDLYKVSKNPANGIVVNEFFNKESITITHTAKFGLSIGDFFELSDQVKKSRSLEQNLSYDPIKGEYQDVQFSANKVLTKKMGVYKTRENSMSLDGEFKSATIATPTVKDLAFDFTVKWSENYKKLAQSTFRSAMDFGLLWEIYDQAFCDNELAVHEGLRDRKVKFSAIMTMKNGSFNDIMSDIEAITDGTIAAVLAASLPWSDFFGRRTPNERIDAYQQFVTPLANRKLPIDPDDFKIKLSANLEALSPNYTALAHFEALDHPNSTNKQLVDVFEVNNFPYHFKHSFVPAISTIINNAHTPVSTFFDENLSRQMFQIVLKPELNMRFLGKLALQLSKDPSKRKNIERTLTIDYSDDSGKDQRIVYVK